VFESLVKAQGPKDQQFESFGYLQQVHHFDELGYQLGHLNPCLTTHPVCNYANNYYGDQICVAQKNPTTKTRISGAA
jgi:hypothetical protein